MKRLLFVLLLALSIASAFAQKTNAWSQIVSAKSGTVTVHYLEQHPFCYKDKAGKLTGIEIDIINEFANWLKVKKDISLKVNFKSYTKFGDVYQAIKGNNDLANLGVATVTITPERSQEVEFSAPYLKNKSLLVSSGSIPTLMKLDDISQKFANLTAVTIKGSVHEHDIQVIKEKYLPNLTIEYVDAPVQVLQKLASDKKYFGYVDILAYWDFVKNNSKLYVKMHKVSIINNENFGIIMPSNGDWGMVVNEFFESGFGFTATKTYHAILERHLGYEVINSVELY